MKRFNITLLYLGAFLFLMVMTCVKKEKKQTEFVVVDSDTIPVEELLKMLPESTLTLKKLGLMITLAKDCPQRVDTAAMNEVIVDFTDQLKRESGKEWTNHGARNLYCAAQAIKNKLNNSKSVQDVQSYLDSLAAKMILSSDSSPVSFSIDSTAVFADTSQAGKKKQLASLLSSLFCLETNLSNVIVEFISSESVSRNDTTAVNDLVKGLVFDSAAAAVEKTKKKTKKLVQRDNSALALKFRSQQSIHETIAKHIPILEGIYKKELKRNSNMAGIVYVTFRVDASGEVISAAIKSSQITSKDFLNPFLDYVKKITFKPIPEKVGAMTFDFPFEFKPER